MFTWVCQRCGSEVDVAQTQCPVCHPTKATEADFGSARGAAKEQASAPQPMMPPPVARQSPPVVEDVPSGPAPLEPPPDVFSLRPSHLLVFVFALLTAVAAAVLLSRPELVAEWRDRLTAPAEQDGVTLVDAPEPGVIEAAGVRAWRDEKAALRVRATLVNHQMSPAAELEYEVLLFAPASGGKVKPLGGFRVQLDEPLAGRTAREVEATLDAPEGLADFPHWSELIARVRRPGEPAEEEDR